MLLFIPLLLLGMGSLFLPAASDMKEYYVTPTLAPNPDCPPGKECHTIYEYARDSSSYFGNQTNASLIFLSGVHNLNRSLDIQEMNRLILTGEKVVSNLENPEIIVDCVQSQCWIFLYSIQEVHLENLFISFTKQQSFSTGYVNYYTQMNTSMAMINSEFNFFSVFSIAIFQSEIISGQLSVSQLDPNVEVEVEVNITECTLIGYGIGIYHSNSERIVAINIKESNITVNPQEKHSGIGLYIRTEFAGFTLGISGSNISGNDKQDGIYMQDGIYIHDAGYNTQSYNKVMIEDTSIINLRYGLLYRAESPRYRSQDNSNNVVVTIKRCEISNISQAVTLSGYDSNVQLTITIQGTTISNCLTALNIDQHSDHSSLTMKLQDSEIVYCSRGLSTVNVGENWQTEMSITNSKISNCEIALQLLVDSNSSLTIKVQDSELVNSSHGISVVNRGESWQTDITIINSTISNSRESGIEFPKPGIIQQSAKEGGNLRMKVLDSMIVKNQGRGLYINVPTNTNFELVIENSVIANTSGISLEAYGDSDFNSQQNLILDLRNVSFLNNRDTSSTKLTTIKVAGISNKVLVHDCLFQGNLGTPIKMILGKLYISGMTKFSDNEGLQGGALSLIFSKVYFANNTEVVLENNIALDTGGAIYVQYVEEFDPCFYQLPYLSDERSIDTQLTFTNNTASTGGDDIYGAVLRSNCSVTADVEGLTITSNSIYDRIFCFINSSRSSISSDPQRVCLCSSNGEPVCDELEYIYTSDDRYPGEVFNISLVVVGYGFGPVSAAVYDSLLPTSEGTSSIDRNQNVQKVDNDCLNVSYSIESTFNEVLVLSASHAKVEFYPNPNDTQRAIDRYQSTNTTVGNLLTTPVFINITVNGCPMGFQPTNVSNKATCKCESLLENNGVTSCTITDKRGLITRDGSQWIGNQSDEVIVSQYCPFGYCITAPIDVDFDDTDQQCVEGRSGILCGQCKLNYSLMLGSSKCSDECHDNITLTLLVAFIGAGLVLVLLIKFLDLTVTMGTINGLIFYANILWANQHILFSNNSVYEPFDQVLQVFIAWINLDFGIETCFFADLNAYWKTWLQFVFPIYIWSLCGLIIFISHHSVLITRFFGNNSISVLATLLLLSYAKLLRTIIKVLSFTYIEKEDDHRVVWTEDGNIDYFRYDHAILFSLSLAMLVVFWMPYMMILLFIQPLKKIAHYGPLRLINKWKPFIDAYVGYLKNRYQYWVGLLLLARGLIFIIAVVTSTIEPKVNLVVIAVITAAIGLHPFVYKNWIISIIEKSFVFNLTTLACGVLYADYRKNDDLKGIIVYTSIGIALVEFVIILLFHIGYLINSCVKWKKNHNWRGQPIIRLRHQRDLRNDDDDEGYREPLLHNMKPRQYNED